jgi:hypothetical protein
MKRVLVVWAASFTGGTWAALVAGSHDDAILLGNPQTFENDLRSDAPKVCWLHGPECPYWSPILKGLGRRKSFLDLVRAVPQPVVVMKNLNQQNYALLKEADDLDVKEVTIIRDFRPMIASYMRKNEGRDVLDTIARWGLTAVTSTTRYMERSDIIFMHGEISKHPEELIRTLSDLVGLDYKSDHLSYWEFDHHPNNGNPNTLGVIADFQKASESRKTDAFYRQHLEQANSPKRAVLTDERWKNELSRFDRYVIDRVIGQFNEKIGFARDQFSDEEAGSFRARFLSSVAIRSELGRIKKTISNFDKELKVALTPLAADLDRQLARGGDFIAATSSDIHDIVPMDWQFDLDPATALALEERQKSAGIRLLPFPFSAAVTITSDTDRSAPNGFRSYVSQLTREHGLDFADSVWLQNNGKIAHAGSAFLTPDLRWRRDEAATFAGLAQSPIELAREYHNGNIDHWHCFYTRGPRFAVMDDVRRQGNKVTARFSKEQLVSNPLWGTAYFVPLVIGVPVATLSGGAVSVAFETAEENVTFALKAATDNPLSGRELDGRQIMLFEVEAPIDSQKEVPFLQYLKSLTISFEQEAPECDLALVINYTRSLTKSRLDFLRNELRVNPRALSQHAQWHFTVNQKEAVNKQKTEKFLEENQDVVGSYYVPEEIGGLRVSQLADDPSSFAYVADFVVGDHGCGLWRTEPASELFRDQGAVGASIYSLVTPMQRRDGGWVYNLNSRKGVLSHPTGQDGLDRRTVARNFADRFGGILDDLVTRGRGADAHYTHLGNLFPAEDDIPTPYFSIALMGRLRRHHWGIGAPQGDMRIWFAKPSVLGTYAVVALNLKNNLTRNENEFDIRRWADSVYGHEFPKAASQLYGVTLYTDRPSDARVRLDGEEIRDLAVNEDDGQGPSVTILAARAVFALFRQLLPTRTLPNCRLRGSLQVLEGQSSLGGRVFRLDHEEGAPAQLRKVELRFDPLTFAGAQVLRVVYREVDGASDFSLGLRTSDGAAFEFHSGERPKTDLTASARIMRKPDAEGWVWAVIPFHSLSWRHEPRGDSDAELCSVPLPMRMIEEITFRWKGDDAAAVEIADISWLRPTADQSDQPESVSLGGFAAPHDTVVLEQTDAEGASLATMATRVADSAGQFYFSGLSQGAYCVRGANRKTCHYVDLVGSDFRVDVTGDQRAKTSLNWSPQETWSGARVRELVGGRTQRLKRRVGALRKRLAKVLTN